MRKGNDKDKVLIDDLKGFLIHNDRNQRAVVPRIKLNLADNSYFSDMLSENPPAALPERSRKSHRLIRDAFSNAARRVSGIVTGLDAKDHGDVLNKWINFIEHNADVILLQVPSGANCYKMFETLNDRGLETTQADLVKNYLFGETEAERLSEAETSWSFMRAALAPLKEGAKEDSTVTFLRHALMAIQGFVRKDAVLEVVQARAQKSQSSLAFLKQIENLAAVYSATFFRDDEKWKLYPDAIRDAIETINFFHIHPFRPVLLSVAAKFTPKEATRTFEMFISLGVRLIVASTTRSGVIEETLAKSAHSVFEGKVSTASDLRKELGGICPSDDQFRRGFEDITLSNAFFARYYLRTLENQFCSFPQPYFIVNPSKESITLEHVLPVKPGKEWSQFTKEEVDTYAWRLGNLALLDHKSNSGLKSDGQKAKFAIYRSCPYELTRQIANVSQWNPKEIINRQRCLADIALKAWPL